MADISHTRGADMDISPSGDLLAVNAAPKTQQRVLRRLLTNPGDYVWHGDYGAGLPRFVGQPVNAAIIQGVVEQQMQLEPAVADSPAPVTTVTYTAPATVFAQVTYADVDGVQSQVGLPL